MLKKMFVMLVLLFSFANAIEIGSSLTADRNQLELYDMDTGKLTKMANLLKGHFTLLWFYDDRCPYTIKSIPELKKFLAYLQDQYGDEVQFIFVEALHRYPQEIYAFEQHFGFNNYKFYMSPSMKMNRYMNVDSTPTLIVLDPFLNIVDKIEEQTIAPVYIRHIDYIMGKYYEAMGYDESVWKPLVDESATDVLNKVRKYDPNME